MIGKCFLLVLIGIATCLGEARTAHAQSDDLSAKTQNPIGSLISVPFENTFDFGAPNGGAYILTMQPVIPHAVNEDWNLIHRPIVPLANAPKSGFSSGSAIINPEPGMASGKVWGLADTNYSAFLSPSNPGRLIWGAGASIQIPTATDDALGSGQWAVGPTAVFLTQPKPWSIGVLLRQIWKFAGSSSSPAINQGVMQPFASYNLDDGWYLTTSPVFVANWNASGEKFTIPLGGGAGRIMKFGNQPVNLKGEAYYNVVKPKSAPDWAAKFTVQFLFPK